MVVEEQAKFILDATASFRQIWFEKNHPNCLYIDERSEVNPDEVQDFRHLPYTNNRFKLIVWDPPHKKQYSTKGIIPHQFGILNPDTWASDLAAGAKELWRVLAFDGVLIFKWNDVSVPLDSVLALFPIKPLFGHLTRGNAGCPYDLVCKQKIKSGKRHNGNTYWMCFMKISQGDLFILSELNNKKVES